MNEGIYITYTNTIDDMVAFSMYHIAHSPTARRTRFRAIWGLALVVLLVAAILSLVQRSFGPLIFAGVWSAVYLAFTIPYYKWSMRRRAGKLAGEGKNRSFLCEHTLRLTDDGLFATSEVSEGKIQWQGIERIAENDDYLFIYTGAGTAIVIPKAKVTSGDLTAFTEELKRHVDQSG